MVLFFKQKTAYEMRISDWRSDVCSSDLRRALGAVIAVVKVADARGGGGADHLFGADGDAVCDRHPPHLEVELDDEAAQLVSVARAPFGNDDDAFAVDSGGLDRNVARGLEPEHQPGVEQAVGGVRQIELE